MKQITGFLCIVALLLCGTLTAFAGDVPESLLYEDGAKVFFAEVVRYEPEGETPTVTVSPFKVVKGDVEAFPDLTCYNPNAVGGFTVTPGRAYLFACLDEHNPTDIFDVTSYDTATLKLKNVTGDMWERFETYLNDGSFYEAELKRIGKGKALEKIKNAKVLADLFVLGREEIEQIAVIYPGDGDPAGCYLDKDKFFDLAEKIELLPSHSNASESLEQNAGIFIMPQDVGDNQYNVWIDQSGNVGSELYVSSERSTEYEISIADYKKLHRFLPKEATAHIPLESPIKPYMVVTGGAVLVLGIAFLVGFWVLRKRRQHS